MDSPFDAGVAGMGIAEVICSPASPSQNPYAERVIGSIRRECLDHVIEFGEVHLRRLLSAYVAYYHRSRTPLGSRRTRQMPDQSQQQPLGRSSRFRKSAAFITATNGRRRKRQARACARHQCGASTHHAQLRFVIDTASARADRQFTAI